jgi:phage replication initiation protein
LENEVNLPGGGSNTPLLMTKSNLEEPFCDWLSFTIDPIFLDDILIFGVKSVELKNWNSYSIAFFTSSSVLIAYNPERPELRLFLSFSSKALYSQKITFEELIKWAIERKGKFTRIDLTKDDYRNRLNLDYILNKIKLGELVTRFRNFTVYENQEFSTIESGKIGMGKGAKTIYLGNLKKSNVIVRIYDKGAKEKVSYPWVRVEFQLRHEVADQYCNSHLLIDPETGEIKKTKNSEKIITGNISERDFPSIANYYLRFLDVTRKLNESILHKRYWKTSKFWKDFIGTDQKNSIGLPKYKAGLEDLREWATRSISGLNYLLEEAYGDDYKKQRKEEGKKKFEENQRYQNLLRDKKQYG